MTVSSYQESYETYPLPTETELKTARELINEAENELENEPTMTAEETITEFEKLRQQIMRECEVSNKV